jgi:hypothetical protein
MMWSRGKVAGNRNTPFDFPRLTRPRYLFSKQVTKQKLGETETAYQQPFRDLRFGSGAPGLLGRGIALQVRLE